MELSLTEFLPELIELSKGGKPAQYAVSFDARAHLLVTLGAKRQPTRKKRKRGADVTVAQASRAIKVRLDVRDAIRDELITGYTSTAWNVKAKKKARAAGAQTLARFYFKKLIFGWPGSYVVSIAAEWKQPDAARAFELPQPLEFTVVVTGDLPPAALISYYVVVPPSTAEAEGEISAEAAAAAEPVAPVPLLLPPPRRPRKQQLPNRLRPPTSKKKAPGARLPKLGSRARDALDASQFHLHEGLKATETTVHFAKQSLFQECCRFVLSS